MFNPHQIPWIQIPKSLRFCVAFAAAACALQVLLCDHQIGVSGWKSAQDQWCLKKKTYGFCMFFGCYCLVLFFDYFGSCTMILSWVDGDFKWRLCDYLRWFCLKQRCKREMCMDILWYDGIWYLGVCVCENTNALKCENWRTFMWFINRFWGTLVFQFSSFSVKIRATVLTQLQNHKMPCMVSVQTLHVGVRPNG